MAGERIHRGLHRMSRKARRSLGLSQLAPRVSFLPSNASRTLRGMPAAAATAGRAVALLAGAKARADGWSSGVQGLYTAL